MHHCYTKSLFIKTKRLSRAEWSPACMTYPGRLNFSSLPYTETPQTVQYTRNSKLLSRIAESPEDRVTQLTKTTFSPITHFGSPKAAFTRQTKVGKLVSENFKILANSCLHTSNSRQITIYAKFATWPTLALPFFCLFFVSLYAADETSHRSGQF